MNEGRQHGSAASGARSGSSAHAQAGGHQPPANPGPCACPSVSARTSCERESGPARPCPMPRCHGGRCCVHLCVSHLGRGGHNIHPSKCLPLALMISRYGPGRQRTRRREPNNMSRGLWCPLHASRLVATGQLALKRRRSWGMGLALRGEWVTFPCSCVSKKSISSECSSSSCLYRNMICARFAGGVSRHAGNAASAAAMAVSTVALVASATCVRTEPVAGSKTSCIRSPAPMYGFPSMICPSGLNIVLQQWISRLQMKKKKRYRRHWRSLHLCKHGPAQALHSCGTALEWGGGLGVWRPRFEIRGKDSDDTWSQPRRY